MAFEILGADGVSVAAVGATSKGLYTQLLDQYGNQMGDIQSLANVLNALNSAVTITLGGQSTVGWDITGTSGTITVTFEGTVNGGTSWETLTGWTLAGTTASTVTANGQWFVSSAGFSAVRARVSSITVGSMAVSAIVTPGDSQLIGSTVTQGPPGTLANAWPVEITDGTNVLGTTAHPVQVAPPGDSSPSTQNVTAQDVVSSSAAGANGQSLVTGVPTAGSVASFAFTSVETIKVQVSGTWTGTLTSEISLDSGTTWVSSDVHQTGTPYTTNQFTANFIGGVNVSGCTNFRIRATAAWTGTATVRVVESDMTNSIYVASPTALRDGVTQSIIAAIKAASTAALATDPSIVAAVSPNSPLYDGFGNPMPVKNRVAMPSTQGGSPISGLDAGLLNRFLRVSEIGTVRTTSENLLWQDAFEGSTVNAFWTQSVTTMTIAQATGVLTLNNSGITTLSTDAIITSQRQFQKYPKACLHTRWKANISANVAANQTLVELGFGAPAGTTAVVNNGAFFRVTAAGNLVAVTSYNGTETVSATLLAQGAVSTTSYYQFDIFVEDGFARFVVTDSNDVPVVDFQQQIPLAQAALWAVSHLPTFARVYVTATGGGAVVKLNIASHDVHMLDLVSNKLFDDQIASTMRQASINPTTYAQTGSSMTAAPATETPSNTTPGYNTLGGDYAVAMTATNSELPVSVFAFQIPTPYSFYLKGLVFSVPWLSTAISVTGIPIWEWLVVANNVGGNLSTGGGQRFPVGLTHFFLSATQAINTSAATAVTGTAGTPLAGQIHNWTPKVPILCLPGTYLQIGYKVFVTSAITTAGVIRGSVWVDGYFE